MARLHLVLAALLFSTGGAVIKLAPLEAPVIAGGRSLIAACLLALVLPSARRSWRRGTWLVAVAYAATMVLFVLSNRLTTAAAAVFLQATAPLYVLVLGRWLLQEPLHWLSFVRLALLVLGMVGIASDAGEGQVTAPEPGIGNLVGILSGVAWGTTLVGLRWIAREEASASIRAVVCGNLLAALLMLPVILLRPPADFPVLGAMGVLGWLGVAQVGLAYVFLTRAVGQLPSLEVSFLLMLEPVLAPVWAYALHGELPGLRTGLGGLVILVASLLPSLLELGRRGARTVRRSRRP